MSIFNQEQFLKTFEELVKIDSTTGYYEDIQSLICGMLDETGVKYTTLHKGGVIAEIGGTSDKALAITAHFDDIGLMVRHINADGTLNVCSVGGLYPVYTVTENVRIHTRTGKTFTGCVCRTPNSVHVTEDELRKEPGDFDKNICIVLDEDVHSADDVRALGIETGDDIALEPRFTVSNGYIKSRFIDDKAAVAILLLAIEAIKDLNNLPHKLYFYFAAYEEIGHGTSWLPDDVSDILAVDIAPTGEKQTSDERKVTIFCKDSRFPYHWAMTNELKAAAEANRIEYVMDIFTPHYGTDCDTSLVAGHDVRHAAIGAGTANSHGYERTHLDGQKATYDLLMAYITK